MNLFSEPFQKTRKQNCFGRGLAFWILFEGWVIVLRPEFMHCGRRTRTLPTARILQRAEFLRRHSISKLFGNIWVNFNLFSRFSCNSDGSGDLGGVF